MADNAPSMPAAWYPDPQDPSRLRYWDGSAWTNHFHPIPKAPPLGEPAPKKQSEESRPTQESADESPKGGKDFNESSRGGADPFSQRDARFSEQQWPGQPS